MFLFFYFIKYNEMSQVKKFQNGTTKGGITPQKIVNNSNKYKIRVDDSDYDVDEEALDTHFDNAFKELVDKGYAKEKDRNTWFNSYKGLKDRIKSGSEIDMTGQNIGQFNFQGNLSNEQLGLTEEGEAARSSKFGRFVKGGVKDEAQRNALLHGLIGKSIGQSASAAKSEYETKQKEEEEKAKTKRKEEVAKLIEKLDPSKRGFATGYFGEAEGSDKNFALNYFWGKGKTDLDRNYMYGKAMANFGKELFSDKYKDKDVIEAAKGKGVDIEQLKSMFTQRGFNPEDTESFANMYKKKGIKSFEDFHNALDILRNDTEYYDRGAYDAFKSKAVESTTQQQAGNAPQVVDTNGTPVDTTISEEQVAPSPKGWRIINGVLTKDGKPFSGFRYHDAFSPSNAWYVGGKPASKEVAEAFVKKNPNQAKDFSSQYQGAIQSHVDFLNKYGFTKLEKQPGTYRPDNFAFSDLIRNTGDSYAKDASADFTGVDRNNASVFEYVTFKGPKDNLTPVRKYRYYDKNKRIYTDGRLEKDLLTGAFIFKSDNGKYKVNIGTANPVISEDVRATRGNLYFGNYKNRILTRKDAEKRALDTALNMKEGGVFKYQEGSDIQRAISTSKPSLSRQRTTATTADVARLNLSTADKWKLGGLAADLGGLVASFTGAGSVAGAGLGVGGSAASFVGDIKQGRDIGESAKDLGINVGLDVLSAVPVLGISAKVPKVAKALKASKTMLNAYFISQGLRGAYNSLSKIDDPGNMTIDDWRNIVGGIQAVMSGKRAVDSAVATTKTEAHTIRANGKNVELSPEQAKSISTAKGKSAKNETAKSVVAEKLGIKPEEVNIESTSKGLSFKATLNPLKSIKVVKTPEISVSKGKVLKDIDEYTGPGIMNWYMRSAIRNTAYNNPLLVGSDKLLAPRFRPNEKGEYVQVFEGSKGGPSWFGSRKNTYISGEKDVYKSTVDAYDKRNEFADKFGLPEKGVTKENKATTDASEKIPVNANEVPKYKRTWREELATEIANRRESRKNASDRLENIKSSKPKRESTLGELIGEERLTRSAARLSSIPVKQGEKTLKRIKESDTRQAAERNVDFKKASESIEAKENIIKEKRNKGKNISEKYKSNKQAKEKSNKLKLRNKNALHSYNLKKKGTEPIVVTNSKGVSKSINKLQASVLSKLKPENRQAFIDKNFKNGGILAFERGGEFTPFYKKIIPGFLGLFSPSNNGQSTGVVKSKLDLLKPKASPVLSKPKIDLSYDKWKPKYSLSKEQTPVKIDYMPEQTNLTKEFGDKWRKKSEENKDKLESIGIFTPERKNRITGLNLPSISGFSEGGIETPDDKKGFFGNIKEGLKTAVSQINPLDISELGRAMAISRHNAGEDTNVHTPIFSQGTETPSSIRGNLFLKSIFDKQATNVIQSANRMASSDPTSNRLTQLAAMKQASEIRQEGAIRDAEALDRSIAADEERQQQYADRRMDVANKNIQSLTSRDEAIRQLKNLKRDKVAQPYFDLWERTNVQAQMDEKTKKDMLAKSLVAKMQQKYSKEIGENQRIIDTYAEGSRKGSLTPEQQEKFNKAYENMNLIQSKMDEEAMNIYANPLSVKADYDITATPTPTTPSAKGFRYIPLKAKGGSIKDRELEVYKEKEKTKRNRETMYNRLYSNKYNEDRKSESKTRDRIHDIIKIALK